MLCLLSRSMFFLSFIAVAVISAQDINLTGRVVDEFGVPVAGASLRLKELHYCAVTNAEGIYTIDKSTIGTVSHAVSHHQASPGLSPRFLELGNFTGATITVLSIRGTVLNRITVTNQNRVNLAAVIPERIHSQTLVIAITAGSRTFTLATVRCEGRWIVNDRAVIESSRSQPHASADAAVLDTIISERDDLQTAATPVSSLVATLPDIVMNHIFIPSTDNDDDDDTSLIGDVAITPPGTTFKTSIAVTLTTTVPGAEIRYTTDGTLPTAASALYDGTPLTLTETTQLRAAAFASSVQQGKPSTAIYIARTFDYTSDIGIIILDAYSGGLPDDKYTFKDVAFFSFDPVNGTASFDNPPSVATRAGYHLRGQSSMMMFAQAPYRVELRNNNDNDAAHPVLGMPADADWALISPCTDNTLMRSVFVFDLGKAMGLATVQYRFVELFINPDGGPLEPSDYEGIYTIMQPIKNRKHILDLKKLKPDDTDPSKLSGGYIFKFDQAVNDIGMLKLECTGAPKMTSMGFGSTRRDTTATCYADLELVSPSDPNQQQIDWITAYIQEFHDALHAKPIGDWKKYIDLNSFVNLQIVNEVSRDVDAWIRSHFMYKDRGKPITAGPLWDYNFALGNYSTDLVGWHVEENRIGSNDWHLIMWDQPEFKTAVRVRYQDLRTSLLSDNSIDSLIDAVKKPINNIAERNFDEWPMGKCSKSMMGGFGGMGGGGGVDAGGGAGGLGGMFGTPVITDSTWTGQVDSLRVWTKARLKSLDSSMATLP